MRYISLLLSLLFVSGAALCDEDAAPIKLPSGAQRALDSYDAQLAKAHNAYLAAMHSEMEKLETILRKEMDLAGKRNDLDQALAIKAKIAALDKAYAPLTTPADKRDDPNDIIGSWHVVKPDGTDGTWTFTATGMAFGPTYHGTWAVKKDCVYISWSGGDTYWDSFPLPIRDVMDGDGHLVPKGSVHAERIVK